MLHERGMATWTTWVLAAACAALASGAVGCGGAGDDAQGEGDEATDSDEASIIGGSKDRVDTAVVDFERWYGKRSSLACTASFISTHVLLTAAHCVTTASKPHEVASGKYVFTMSADASHPKLWYSVVRDNIHIHPGYDPRSFTNDIAVVVLEHDHPVQPLALMRARLGANDVGHKVKIVGYGQARATAGAHDGWGVRRSEIVRLDEIKGGVVRIGKTGHQGCEGDSGGPAIMSEPVIIGTDDYSFATQDCHAGEWYQRIDTHLAFIEPFLR